MMFARVQWRAIALALDLFFCLVIWIAANALLDMTLDRGLGSIATIALLLAYFVASTASRWQGTPGKHLVGIKVADVSGPRIGYLRAALRLAATMLSVAIFGLGFVFAFWNPKRRALHDFISGTVVVDAKATPEAISTSNPPALPLAASIGKTALFAFIIGAPVLLYEYPMHGREARRINQANYARAADVIASLEAYKQKNGRYPENLRVVGLEWPKLEPPAVLQYTSSPSGDQCWLAIVYWMRAGFLPSDDANEYDCASRTWRLVDFNELKAKSTDRDVR